MSATKQIDEPRNDSPQSAPGQDAVLTCEDIQSLLMDYMTRELGEARSVVVREHIRKCDACRREAAEMQSTFDLLRQVSNEEAALPDHLNEDHRRRLLRAVMHPVLDWMARHHRLVSALVTLLVLLLVFIVLRAPKKVEDHGPSIPIWKYFRSGDLPALVDDARRKAEEENESPIAPPENAATP